MLSGDCDGRRFATGQSSKGFDVRVRHSLGGWRGLTACLFRRTLTAVAFWVAVVVPFLSLALLVGGFTTRGERVAFVVLLAVNVVAFGVGHAYRHPEAATDTPEAAPDDPEG